VKILFVHANYPAQFRNVAVALAANPSNQVVFLSGNPKADPWQLPGVSHLPIKEPPQVNTSLHPWLQATDLAIRNGELAVRAMAQLKKLGFEPDLAISHAGTGYGLFIKDMFPKAKIVSYFEWFFRDHTLLDSFPEATQDELVLWKRSNMTLLEELEACDLAVAPTRWQQEQLPAAYQKKIRIVFDGIATDFFHPSYFKSELFLESLTSGISLKIRPEHRLITYATRGMEPIRGFPEFMRLVPQLLQHFKDALVVIAGEDRSCYGPAAPSHRGSWKDKMLEELKGELNDEQSRIQFIGSLTYPQYRDLLCRSDLHCYFTRPYVPSWSLFEAAACGSRLLTNQGRATETIVTAGKLPAVDLDNPLEIRETAIDYLKAVNREERQARESFLPPRYSIGECMKRWNELLNAL
jgi:hypothetical protein